MRGNHFANQISVVAISVIVDKCAEIIGIFAVIMLGKQICCDLPFKKQADLFVEDRKCGIEIDQLEMFTQQIAAK